jgi:predicted small integral membrane protein
MLITRLAKIVMVAAIAALAALVAYGNVTDYGTNFAFVQHVMSMDTVFPNSTITYRAIGNPSLHRAAYMIIIAAEVLTAALCCIGSALLLLELRAPAAIFHRTKAIAIAGLTLGFLTWQFGFMTIGGEWFGMWMSAQWNGVPSAFRFVMVIVAVLIFVAMRDDELGSEPSE